MHKKINTHQQDVHLEIESFAGLSLGAIHYYGKLCGYVEGKMTFIELERILDEDTAAEYNRREQKNRAPTYCFKYKAGQKTRGFDTKHQVIEQAVADYLKHFPKARRLLRGNPALDNNEVLHEADPKCDLCGRRALYTLDRLVHYCGHCKRKRMKEVWDLCTQRQQEQGEQP